VDVRGVLMRPGQHHSDSRSGDHDEFRLLTSNARNVADILQPTIATVKLP
jgi:hypothetical protein